MEASPLPGIKNDMLDYVFKIPSFIFEYKMNFVFQDVADCII